MKENSEIVGIKRVGTELEGIHLKKLLNDEGIDCMLFSFHDTAFDGISQAWAEGDWGELRVFKKDEEKALKTLKEYEESKPESAEE